MPSMAGNRSTRKASSMSNETQIPVLGQSLVLIETELMVSREIRFDQAALNDVVKLVGQLTVEHQAVRVSFAPRAEVSQGRHVSECPGIIQSSHPPVLSTVMSWHVYC